MDNPKQLQGDYKVPLHLVPPGLTIYAAMALGEGGKWKAKPYGPYNFRDSPVEVMTYIGGIMRHLADFLDGTDIDPDSPINKPSLAGVAGSLAILIDAIENGNAIDNRPKKGNARAMMDRFEGEIRGHLERQANPAVGPITDRMIDNLLSGDGHVAETFGPLADAECFNCGLRFCAVENNRDDLDSLATNGRCTKCQPPKNSK